MKKILIYNSGGGLGDSIQIIPIILSLKNHYRRCTIFYLGAHKNHFEDKLKEYNVNSIVKMASSYKFCVIATGEFDIYAARERANEWDYAAGHAVAQNAGAIIQTLDEKPFLYGKEDYKNPSLLIRRAENLND